MEYYLCDKSKYARKSEYRLSLRIKTRRNDVERIDGSLCDKHFQITSHSFNVQAKFTIIEQIKSLSKSEICSL